jgi:hypothetical protein
MLVQRIEKKYANEQEIAEKWFSILSILNDLKFTGKQIKLLALTATKGEGIITPGVKEYFIKEYRSSKASIANLIGILKETGCLMKDGNRMKLHPSFPLEFKEMLLQIHAAAI